MNRLIPATAAVLLFTSFLALEFGGSTQPADDQTSTKTVAEVALDRLTDGGEHEAVAADLVAAEGDAMAIR